MPERMPRDAATFVLAGTAWATSGPAALNLDGNGGKLPGILLGARAQLRRTRIALTAAGALDALRALLSVRALLAGWAPALAHAGVAPSAPDGVRALLLSSVGGMTLGAGLHGVRWRRKGGASGAGG